MSRIAFPQGFRFGAATAAYAIEGACREDGKGESIWDRFAHAPGRVREDDTGDVACDSYHRFSEDVALLRDMNLTSYRFSIAWPRIQPEGRGAASSKGLDYYSRLVDALLAARIRPFPTLYHWDLPQRLEERGGWTSRETAGRFVDYAEIVGHALCDRVEELAILSEPSVFLSLGYLDGVHAPGRTGLDTWLRASHVVNIAQGQAFQALRALSSRVRLGSAFSFAPCVPMRDRREDEEAAERWHGVSNAWFLDPALGRGYPDVHPRGLPEEAMDVQPGDLDLVKAPFDFLGVSFCARCGVEAGDGGPLGVDAIPRSPLGLDQGERTGSGCEVWPDALRDVLLRLTRDYDSPEIEITGNGCAYPDAPDADGIVRDDRRIDFYRGHLEAVARAVDEGARVVSYHAWSLLDHFAWAEGYGQRFGLAFVDFATGTRTLKQSGRFYAEVASEGALES